jgi:hypothetical protein
MDLGIGNPFLTSSISFKEKAKSTYSLKETIL